MSDSLSPEAQIKAAATLARGGAVTMVLHWVLMIGVPALAGMGGWVIAKVDTKDDLVKIRESITSLTSEQSGLTKRIDSLYAEPDGEIFKLRVDMRYAHRNAVRATAMALSTARDRKGKIKAADTLAAAFDNVITNDHEPPRVAAATAISSVAVQ